MAGETERPRRKTSVARTSADATTSGAEKSRAAGKPVVRAGARAGSATATGAIERLEAAVAELTAERDRLRRALTATEARVSALEAQNRAAVDRINWVIDSLQSALDD